MANGYTNEAKAEEAGNMIGVQCAISAMHKAEGGGES